MHGREEAGLTGALGFTLVMPSPKARRNSGVAVAGNGRLELHASSSSPSSSSPASRSRLLDSVSRRRASSITCAVSAPPPLSPHARPSQSLPAVALRSLLAVDVWFSRRMALCAGRDAPLSGMRPLVKLLEFTGHPAPWIAITLYLLSSSETAEEQEVMINLFLGNSVCHT